MLTIYIKIRVMSTTYFYGRIYIQFVFGLKMRGIQLGSQDSMICIDSPFEL